MDFQFGWLLNLIVYLPLVGALLMMAFVNKENSTRDQGLRHSGGGSRLRDLDPVVVSL